MNIKQEAESYKPQIMKWFRDLHQIPEIGTDLPKTSAYVQQALTEMGIPFFTFEDHSAVVGIVGKEGGKVAAIRADMDALPVEEEADVEYRSGHPGKMHACGHDSHAAMLLGVARILKNHEEELPGMVKLFFQTSEERFPSGASLMVRDGVLENPHVDGMFAAHCMVPKSVDLNGTIALKKGFMTASADGVEIYVKGKGGHASQPDKAVDPVVIAAHITLALQEIISRELGNNQKSVLTIGKIEGGTVGNVIPEQVYLQCSLRADSEETRILMKKRIEEICTGIARTMRGSCEVQFSDSYLPAMHNDDHMTDIVIKTAAELIGEDKVTINKNGMMGSEDCSFFFRRVPGCYFMLQAGKPYKDGQLYNNHNPKFAVDDSFLYIGTALLAASAWNFLEEKED